MVLMNFRFMQSDPWWSFAMAINVYMVFFFSANPKSFLGYWWAYFIVCYGIPLVPSLSLLLVKSENTRGVYGNATVRVGLSTAHVIFKEVSLMSLRSGAG
jgi:hypothetical protein